MNKVIIPLSIVLISVAGCTHKTIPNRVEQLKAERAAAMRADTASVAVNSAPQNNTDFVSAVSPNAAAYVDSAYANYTYKAMAAAFADTIAENPNENDISLDYANDFVGSTNFNMRKPNFVIIHHTAQDSVNQTLRTFTLAVTQVSAHYVIGRDGSIHHMVNDYLRAWHAGGGKWGNVTDMNSCSVGIELDNNGYEPFTDAQINSLLQVLESLKKRFAIPAANFIGHADFAPVRKDDPDVYFPWKMLAQHGFGLWWDDTTGVQVPENFDCLQALRIIGYDVSDSAKAIIAFRRHFCGTDSADGTLSPQEQKILFCLYKKYW